MTRAPAGGRIGLMQSAPPPSSGYAAISLHLDSMGYAYGWPRGFQDPVFHEVLDRFENLARWYDLKYTVQVIGRDLLQSEHSRRVRRLADAGHEIGNHTWSHHSGLAGLNRRWLEGEIIETHYRIAEVIGREPRGFTAPAWNYSERASEILLRRGYRYDASLLPSMTGYPVMLENALANLHRPWRMWRSIHRRDWAAGFRAPREPFLRNGLVILPVPTTPGRIATAVWHGYGRIFGWKRHFNALRQTLAARRYFYYVVHPSDLCCDGDLDGNPGRARFGGNFYRKARLLSDAFAIISDSGKRMTTLLGMSEVVRQEIEHKPQVIAA
jgi:peptidoglycan/xylan/chitin deacetylase (PgdA/CDA1 family)